MERMAGFAGPQVTMAVLKCERSQQAQWARGRAVVTAAEMHAEAVATEPTLVGSPLMAR